MFRPNHAIIRFVIIYSYNLLALVLVSGSLLLLSRSRSLHSAPLALCLALLIPALGIVSAFLSPITSFGKIQLSAWAIFVHYPLFLGGMALLFWKRQRVIAYGATFLAACILLVGIDAFFIEPHWLEITRVTIPAAKLKVPVRVVVIADIQTDNPGQYEEWVLELAKAEEPDLILLAGDYLHISNHDRYRAATVTLNDIMDQVGLDAPLGIYAVKGNVDRQSTWREIFAGLPVTPLEKTTTLAVGPLALTGLTLEDSSNVNLSVEPQETFHIVLGHSPNFSLGQVNADLLIAGHTHGGQVQIPFIGPVLTLSAGPRSWASGMTRIAPGKTLIVSRGVGMERGQAPRLRFLCRPQLLVLDLVPA